MQWSYAASMRLLITWSVRITCSPAFWLTSLAAAARASMSSASSEASDTDLPATLPETDSCSIQNQCHEAVASLTKVISR